jgi:hypothetical protein
LKFLLHTPKSDIGVDYPYNKEGWGIDFTKGFGTPACEAIVHTPDNSQGSPLWAITRERGYGWLNTGRGVLSTDSKNVESVNLGAYWLHSGSTPAPYIHNQAPDGQSYPDYLYIGTAPNGRAVEMDIVPVVYGNGTFMNANIELTFRFNTNWSPPMGSGFKAFVWLQSRGGWFQFATELYYTYPAENKWHTKNFDITQFVTNPNDLANGNIKIRIETFEENTGLTFNVRIAAVRMNVVKSVGTREQNDGDFFRVNFATDSSGNYPTITACYIECRADTACYPRSYSIWVQRLNNEWQQVISTTTIGQDRNTDVIHSFAPIQAKALTIRLMQYSSQAAWGVSQVYVYKAETTKYKPCVLDGESAPETSPTANPYVYTGGPYIKGFSNQCENYPRAVGH